MFYTRLYFIIIISNDFFVCVRKFSFHCCSAVNLWNMEHVLTCINVIKMVTICLLFIPIFSMYLFVPCRNFVLAFPFIVQVHSLHQNYCHFATQHQFIVLHYKEFTAAFPFQIKFASSKHSFFLSDKER